MPLTKSLAAHAALLILSNQPIHNRSAPTTTYCYPVRFAHTTRTSHRSGIAEDVFPLTDTFQSYPAFTRFDCKAFLVEALRYFNGSPERMMIDNTHVVVLRGTGRTMVPVPEMSAFAEQRKTVIPLPDRS